ncbi:MAG: AraC family transcriptional regulator [Spongiibacteraceae bacterium]
MYSTLQFIVTQLHQRSLDTASITANSGINQADLDDPWPFLSYEQYNALVGNIYRLTDDPAIGLHLNSSFKACHLGVPGYAALTCNTFAQARKVIMKYRVLKDPYLFLTHYLNRDSWTIQFSGYYPANDAIDRFSIEGHALRTVRFCRDLTGRDDAIKAVTLRYAPPEYAHLYQKFLQCDVSFNQPENTVIFNHDILNQQLPAANLDMFNLCSRECDLRLSQLDDDNAFKNKVYQELFRAHSQDKNTLLNLYEISSRLYISPRTLRRKLANENTTFKIITNETRRDLAFYYLENTTLTTKEIAYMLGYSSVNNFHRAFKQWTGSPVSSFQKNNIRRGETI